MKIVDDRFMTKLEREMLAFPRHRISQANLKLEKEIETRVEAERKQRLYL
jgi:hypothetical protein